MYRDGHVFKVPMSILALFALILISGCATTPTTPKTQFTATQHWHRDIGGAYVHVSGQVISEDRYAQLVADEVIQQLNGATKKIPKNCKRKVLY